MFIPRLLAARVHRVYPQNEAAQCAGIDGPGSKPWCGCWVHNGFVNIGAEKMSKSLGNFKVLGSACPTALEKRAFRYLVVSSHYRSSLTYTSESLEAAAGAVSRIDKLMKALEGVEGSGAGAAEDEGLSSVASKAREKFYEAVADDLKMPRAAAAIFDVVKAAEKEVRKNEGARDGAGLSIAKGVLQEVRLRRLQEATQLKAGVFAID